MGEMRKHAAKLTQWIEKILRRGIKQAPQFLETNCSEGYIAHICHPEDTNVRSSLRRFPLHVTAHNMMIVDPTVPRGKLIALAKKVERQGYADFPRRPDAGDKNEVAKW